MIYSRNILLLTIAFMMVATASCVPSDVRNLPGYESEFAGNDNSSPVWPPPPQTPRIRYVTSLYGAADLEEKKSWFGKALESVFGAEETQPQMRRPYGIFAYADRIYVTDPDESMLHIFDIGKGKYSGLRGIRGEDLVSPIGIFVDKDENIYLSDSMLRKVFVLNKEQKLKKEIGSPGQFLRPTGIALHDNRIYVVDTHGHDVLVFDKDSGKYLFRFGKNGSGNGEFNYPTNIFIDKSGLIYITDSLNFRVQIFDKDGNFISGFGKLGDGSGNLSKPKGIAVDSDGHIYVADAHFDNVQIFDKKGTLLLGFGRTGRGKGEMILPAGVFIDGKDRIYVADSFNSRIQIFRYLKEPVRTGKTDTSDGG
jgi:DNA-binding beta-propeller fold protein YncE